MVKQIVGGSLKDAGDTAEENFVSEKDGAFYARLYQKKNLPGGHIILLNPASSPYYKDDVRQALSALRAWPGGLQIGGGMNPGNAASFLDAGASHVIVTSYVFSNGIFNRSHLDQMIEAVGCRRLVLDLSVRRRDNAYYIVTDRWQKFTEHALTPALLESLTSSCDEFLIHAVDAEGKASGIETELVQLLSAIDGFPVTYAGGVGTYDDLRQLKTLGQNRIDVTIGSALDLFGGALNLETVLEICKS